MDALLAVRRRIARALSGGTPGVDARLGDITLRPHQVDAVHRVHAAFRDNGGVLLADAPGLGKTFVALAVARDLGGAIVAAPASLRGQWMRAAAQAGVRIRWCSLETLSRRALRLDGPLLVVDEAHHLRNPATRRYAHAAALAIGRPVLLISATPVHNRPADRHALLALFRGSGAVSLSASSLARLVVRRTADPQMLPVVGAMHWLDSPTRAAIGPLLRGLPPPLPASDGRAAAALVRLTLAHAWSSSVAALDATLRRAVHRAGAIDDALRAGRWPTRRELRAWVTSAESSQLAFPELIAAPSNRDIPLARAALARHVGALDLIRRRVAEVREKDAAARARLLTRVLRSHRDATVVAFSRYAATVDALWRALRFEPGVVAITANRVRSAGGGLQRRDVLEALALPGSQDARAPLRLVLSTDLLGEGLDLNAASVVVHLDQPWTPALLDQREGRASRLSSPHASIAVYAVRPPPGAERLLLIADRLRTKRTAMDESMSAGSVREEVLALVRPWLVGPSGGARLATVGAARGGWVAAVRTATGEERVIAAGNDGTVVTDDVDLLVVLRRVAGVRAVEDCPARTRAARRAVRDWLRSDTSAHLAGASSGSSTARVAVVRRLDAALRVAPLHRRAELRPRIAGARAIVTGGEGAGVERALAKAAGLSTIDEVLNALDRITPPMHGSRVRRGRTRLLALLVLIPGEGREPRPV